MRNTSGELSPRPRLPSLFWNTAADPPLCRASRKAGILQQGSLSELLTRKSSVPTGAEQPLLLRPSVLPRPPPPAPSLPRPVPPPPQPSPLESLEGWEPARLAGTGIAGGDGCKSWGLPWPSVKVAGSQVLGSQPPGLP